MGNFTITLGNNINIGTFLFCDVLKFLLKNYYSGDRKCAIVENIRKKCAFVEK